MTHENFGYLDVTLDFLPVVYAALPADYRIVGSHSSIAPGTIRLVVKSEHISGKGGLLRLLCVDRDSVRTITVEHTPAAT